MNEDPLMNPPEEQQPEENQVETPSSNETTSDSTVSSYEESLFGASQELNELNQSVEEIKAELRKYLVGQTKMIELILTAILADGHILLEGVPGVAKTMTAKLLASTLNVGFSRIQFTPDLMPSDITGTSIFNPKTTEFEFKKGPIFSNIILIDEINRSPAKTQAALFESMEERHITADGIRYELAPPFIVLATQNPVEQEGSYKLQEAQLDRFMFKILVDYPTQEEEVEILSGIHHKKEKYNLEHINAILTSERIATLRDIVKNIRISEGLIKYIAEIVSKTRNNPALYLGASPRASIALMQGAKASAAIQGRSFVTPEDIKEIAFNVLGHRVVLTPEKELEGVTIKDTITDLIDTIEIPR